MKRILMALALMTLIITEMGLRAQTTFLDPAYSTVSTPITAPYCFPSTRFDLETINADGFLDIAFGKAYGTTYPDYYAIQDYNNGSGEFPTQNGTFLFRFGDCSVNRTFNNVLFGKLRQNEPRKDIAMLCEDSIFIFLNTGNGIASPRNQALPGVAKDGSWGAFDQQDGYDDLAVTDWNQVKIYRSLNNGTVDPNPVFSSYINATRVVLAQMNATVFEPSTSFNKWDLVSISGNVLSIRINDNNNGFNAPQTIDMGTTIYDVAVGDVNNDNFNDVVVALYQTTRVYLNAGGGIINTLPSWSVTAPSTRVLLGDLGGPGDPNKNDGWNDIFISDNQLQRKIFINQRNGSFNLEQSFAGHPDYSLGKVLFADVQNTGGLSLVFGEGYAPVNVQPTSTIKILKHVGNPAPAPPKNASWQPSGGHPMINWSANSERDIAGYYIYKKSFGLKTYTLAAQVGSSQTSWTDLNSSFCTSNCLGSNQYYVTAHDNASNFSDASNVVSVPQNGAQSKRGVDSNTLPGGFALHAAYPNPFNPSTQIKFDLPEDGYVSLNVFDVLGRKVAELASGNYAAGYHSATWNASNVSSGVYFVRFTATDALGRMKVSKINKLILNK